MPLPVADGNLASSTDPSGLTTFSWDARNRLAGLTGPNGTAAFTYDPLGRRGAKTVNGQLTQFIYDGLDIAQQLDSLGTTGYLRSLNIDEAVSFTNRNGTYFSIYDPLGSTLAVTDSSAASVVQYTYAPFGTTSSTDPAFPNPFQYTGRESDGTGLYYYRARYYQPTLHRFVSEDPIGFWGGDSNLYTYVRNSPTTLIDPGGLLAFFWHGGISALAAYNSCQSITDSLVFGLNTMLVDRGTQGTSAADANIHAMLGTTDINGAAVLQTPAEAARRIELIIATGPDYLAAHTVQDKAAADHYLQPWFGFRWDWATAVHLWHDTVPSLRELQNAYQGTRAVLARRKASCTTAP